ncbi:glutamyl-Q tRNA(Asp) synthetase [Roseivivax sediminis]|uniref:Glutamyl-Q tRNA(Asp) synthetase n=2 Tax=Roseivivax sediminis TaxID=936889 RepID=A0A1I1VHU3_9RHOB|nr:glutamyl-Q tRNA(Asp) synthetase [Roseivivax sediminis]
MLASDLARDIGGTFHLRIEDIDRSRARDHWEAQIYTDLAWLGLRWEHPVLRQSERMDAYRQALETLWRRGFLYPCSCRRRDIRDALAAPQEGAPVYGPDGPVYPGTCRPAAPPAGSPPHETALRLDMRRALQSLDPASLWFEETTGKGRISLSPCELIDGVGDVVLARRDMGTSYHLSVVVDDAAQGITHVTRGEDLFEATAVHVVLQRLMDMPSPIYQHHRLIRDAEGKRLAKRDDARSIARYREDGLSPADIRQLVDLTPRHQ